MSKDNKVYFKDPFNFESFLSGGENWANFVEDGPAADMKIDLAINEFDPKLSSNMNFTDPESFKAVVCPLGLEELRAVLHYELMNLQALIVGTKTNQILIDNLLRQLAEIDFFANGFTVSNPTFDLFNKLVGQNLFENNLKKLPTLERSAC